MRKIINLLIFIVLGFPLITFAGSGGPAGTGMPAATNAQAIAKSSATVALTPSNINSILGSGALAFLPPADGTDQTAAIQAVLLSGATRVIGSGTYKIGRTLNVPSGVSFEGASRGALIIQPYPIGGIRGGGINTSQPSWATGTCYSAISMCGVTGSSVKNIIVDNTVYGCVVNGITMVPSGGDTTLSGTACSDCLVENCEVRGYYSLSGGYLIWSVASLRCKILNNHVDGGMDGVINIFPVPNASVPDQEGIELMGGTGCLVMGNTGVNLATFLSCGTGPFQSIGNKWIGNSGDNVYNGATVTASSNYTHTDDIFANNTIHNAHFIAFKWIITQSNVSFINCLSQGNQAQGSVLGFAFWAQYGTNPNIRGFRSIGDSANGCTGNNTINSVNYSFFFQGWSGDIIGASVTDGAFFGISVGLCTDLNIFSARVDNVYSSAISVGSSTRVFISGSHFVEWDMALVGYSGIAFSGTCSQVGSVHNRFYRVAINETYAVRFDSPCDQSYEHGNILEYPNTYNSLKYANSSTNSNRGIITVAAAGAFAQQVSCSWVAKDSMIAVQQLTGTPVPTSVVYTSSPVGFQLVGTAAGACTFQYEVE